MIIILTHDHIPPTLSGQAQLVATDAEAFDRFGGAVGIDGGTVARQQRLGGTGEERRGNHGENRGKTVGKVGEKWENHGETMGKPSKNGKTRGKVGDFHDFHGNTWENMVKLCDFTGKHGIFS